MGEKPNYGTWIRVKKILIFLITSILFLIIACFGFKNKILYLAALPGVLFGYIATILILTVYQFSSRGGCFQNKIHDLIVNEIDSAKNILDIGCGNGGLSIKLAKKFPNARICGVDFWGTDWEYGKDSCEKNSRIENVGNISFQKASASALPINMQSMDVVVSCLTFHEVKDVIQKEDCLAEALRVIPNGGRFVFFDLFDDTRYYTNLENVIKVIVANGGNIQKEKKLSDLMLLPFPLNSKNALKYARLIVGNKVE